MTQQNVILNYSNLTESKIRDVKKNYISLYTDIFNNILSIPNEKLSWNNLVEPHIKLDNSYVDNALLDMKDFYSDEKIRTICTDVSTEFESWSIEQSMRKDIYAKYKYYADNIYPQEKVNFNQEQKSYFDDLMVSYSINGMNLPDDKFNHLKEIKKEINELCSEFNLNLGNENYVEYINVEQLKGLPENYIKERLQEDGSVKVTLKYPDYIPIMEYATNRDIRKYFNFLFKRRCTHENTPIIERVFNLRANLASLFGFDNYSDYKLQQSMAESTQNVNDFLKNLYIKVEPLLINDLTLLQTLATADLIDKLELYDIAYYSRIYVEKTCDFDKEQLKQYFPVEKVISGGFEIYQKLLGYTFEKVVGQEETFWNNEVELYKVINSETSELVGYFYLDLYPREGKYGHAACFPFITKSSLTLPVATIACNFNKGNLSFDEVETFFHEFGHVMHHLSSISTIKSTAGFACEHDFVETPSQMFEEWCYTGETLKMMSTNLPNEMIDKLNNSRKLLQGYHYARQLLFALFDMTIHSSMFKNIGLTPAELFAQIQKDILKLDAIPNTSELASFGHLMGGYDAGYYGYLWSLVYAKDLFSRFKPDHLLDTQLGVKLRKEVLSQGSIRKSMESIKVFLERDPNSEEFVKSII